MEDGELGFTERTSIAKGGLQIAISADAEPPEVAAIFLDDVVSSPEAREVFGAMLVFPRRPGWDDAVTEFISEAQVILG